jgi:hypothetical protein
MARAFLSREDYPGAGVNTLYSGDFGAILSKTVYAAMAAHNIYKQRYREKQRDEIPACRQRFQEMMGSLVSDAEHDAQLDSSMKRHLNRFLKKGLAIDWGNHEQISELTYSGIEYQKHMKSSHRHDLHTSNLVVF